MSDLVIDADIMRAAGLSEHPHSSNARRALETIRQAGHRMVQSSPLKAEHDRHQSLYARQWRASMISRRQFKLWPYQEDKALRKLLIAAQPLNATAQESAALKDAHLLECAASTDRRIVSKDTTARALFRRACPSLGHHRDILWGDLTHASEEVIQWLAKGCPERPDFKLCPPPPPKAKRAKRGAA